MLVVTVMLLVDENELADSLKEKTTLPKTISRAASENFRE